MTNRNMLIIGALLIVLLIIGYYFLLLSPLLGKLDEQAKAKQDKQAQLSQVQQNVNDLEAVKKNSPDIERQLLELSKRIPAQPQIPTFVVQVQEIADASGVTQLSVDPGASTSPAGGGDYKVLPVTMQFNGTYNEMQDFLLRTRNLARLVTVTNVCYTGNNQGGAQQSSCPVSTGTTGAASAAPGNGATTPSPSAEATLSVAIKADVYFQPTAATSGQPPPTVVSGTTTPQQPQETTSGG